MDDITLDAVYDRACGSGVIPYPFQRAVAENASADVLIAPTGLGKTEAVTLGWAWRRLNAHPATPRRLVWCLPMRTLVEQTAHKADKWMTNLAGLFVGRGGTPSVHILMGGAVDGDWRLRPEDPAIIVGTQDMLLSRALMRGYGMGRFGWPIDYGLLHNDALWVFDEVQLMGAGLATSAQLEAFRRRQGWRREGLARSLWVSATLDPDWLGTAEFRSEIPAPTVLRWDDGTPPEPPGLSARLDAVKRLRRAETTVTAESAKAPAAYAKSLAREVASAHRRGTTTLVIVNTVGRAQALYQALAKTLDVGTGRLLIHSRFRPRERQDAEASLLKGTGADRVVVATQAVEAGVDMTSAVLFTELAPWSSLVQRFGRCNRGGECNAHGGAEIRWIDVETTGDGAAARPYTAEELAEARDILAPRDEVSPRKLPPPSRPALPGQVIRPNDFEELFDTDADLSGYDLDISPYIRDGDDVSVSLFWRAIGDGSAPRIAAVPPRREELCAAPLNKKLQDWLAKNRPVYVENPLASGKENGGNNWVRLDVLRRRLHPGMTLLLDVGVGGYDPDLGFVGPEGTAPVAEVASADPPPEPGDADISATTEGDPRALDAKAPVPLERHLDEVAACAGVIAGAVGLPAEQTRAVVRAAAWHDRGKAYAPFQALLGRAPDGPLLAKSGGEKGTPRPEGLRKYFRHELASALAFLQQHDTEPDADLVAFLIAAHHGKVRMGLRALPDEALPADPALHIARGVQDGDPLPELRCGEEVSAPVALDLGLMEMGEDEHGRPSWAARTQALLATYGPFRLAYLEALVRMADWRGSATAQKGEGRDE